MHENQQEHTETLLTLLEVARQDITDYLEQAADDDTMRQACNGHLENVMLGSFGERTWGMSC